MYFLVEILDSQRLHSPYTYFSVPILDKFWLDYAYLLYIDYENTDWNLKNQNDFLIKSWVFKNVEGF